MNMKNMILRKLKMTILHTHLNDSSSSKRNMVTLVKNIKRLTKNNIIGKKLLSHRYLSLVNIKIHLKIIKQQKIIHRLKPKNRRYLINLKIIFLNISLFLEITRVKSLIVKYP